jgi:D-tyrosyl-tRNA(Tyr) deacylase
MRVVLQRVTEASVEVDGRVAGSIGDGFVALVGVREGDVERDAELLAKKTADLRVFRDDKGKMNRPIESVDGSVLVVSQFTLHADCRKGRRPSFVRAADPDTGERLVERYAESLRERGVVVETGVFGAMMNVALVNDGPVTIILDTDELG